MARVPVPIAVRIELPRGGSCARPQKRRLHPEVWGDLGDLPAEHLRVGGGELADTPLANVGGRLAVARAPLFQQRYEALEALPVALPIELFENSFGTRLIEIVDPDSGQTHTFSISTPPENGDATVGTDGLVMYTPDADFIGRDSLVVGATMSEMISANVTVRAWSRNN